MSVGLILDIAISGTVYGYDKLYSYKLPSDIKGDDIKGKRVLVPFGNGNRKRVALVVDVREGELSKLKPIASVIDETPLLSEEMLCLLLWLKETTLCTYFDALKCLIPSAMSVNFERKYQLSENIPDDIILTEEENNLLSSLKSSKNQKEFDLLLDTSSNPSKKNIVNSLIDKDIIIELDRVKRRIKDNTLVTFRLSEEYLSGEIKSELTPKQKKVAEVLSENECASAKELCYLCNISETTVKNMLKKGILTEYEYEVILPSDAVATENPKDIILSDEQQNAFSEISSKIDENKPSGALLFGVTGSGKTSVL